MTQTNRVLGMDCSRYQGRVNFKKAFDAGARFVILRASVGDYYTDPLLKINYLAAKDAGLLVSFYHATAPRNPELTRLITAAANIALFMDAIAGLENDLPLWLDNELVRGLSRIAYSEFLESCFELCPNERGEPVNYTRQTIWDLHTIESVQLMCYPLHAARYSDRLGGPWSDGRFKFRDFDEWKFWQWSADGNKRGAEFGVESDSIDLNWFNGTEEELFEFCGRVVEPVEEITLESLERRVRALEHLIMGV